MTPSNLSASTFSPNQPNTMINTLTITALARLAHLLAQSRERRDLAITTYKTAAHAVVSTHKDLTVVCLSYYGHGDDGSETLAAMSLPCVADIGHVGNTCPSNLSAILRRLRVQAQVAHDLARSHDDLVTACRIARAGLTSPDAAVSAALDA